MHGHICYYFHFQKAKIRENELKIYQNVSASPFICVHDCVSQHPPVNMIYWSPSPVLLSLYFSIILYLSLSLSACLLLSIYLSVSFSISTFLSSFFAIYSFHGSYYIRYLGAVILFTPTLYIHTGMRAPFHYFTYLLIQVR